MWILNVIRLLSVAMHAKMTVILLKCAFNSIKNPFTKFFILLFDLNSPINYQRFSHQPDQTSKQYFLSMTVQWTIDRDEISLTYLSNVCLWQHENHNNFFFFYSFPRHFSKCYKLNIQGCSLMKSKCLWHKN